MSSVQNSAERIQVATVVGRQPRRGRSRCSPATSPTPDSPAASRASFLVRKTRARIGLPLGFTSAAHGPSTGAPLDLPPATRCPRTITACHQRQGLVQLLLPCLPVRVEVRQRLAEAAVSPSRPRGPSPRSRWSSDGPDGPVGRGPRHRAVFAWQLRARRTISTFSCDIARAVSRGGRRPDCLAVGAVDEVLSSVVSAVIVAVAITCRSLNGSDLLRTAPPVSSPDSGDPTSHRWACLGRGLPKKAFSLRRATQRSPGIPDRWGPFPSSEVLRGGRCRDFRYGGPEAHNDLGGRDESPRAKLKPRPRSRWAAGVGSSG